MSSRIPLCILFALITFTSLTAQGQDNNPAHIPALPPAQEGDIICHCVSTFLPKNNQIFYFKIGSSFHKVSLAGEGMSLPFPVRESTTFTLYKKTPEGKDAPPYVPVVQQALQGGGKKFLVILSRKDDKSPIKGKAYNISKTQRPANNIYLFNESPVAIGIQVNKTQGVVKPFKKYKYAYPNASRNTYTSANIIMRYKGEKRIMASKRLRLIPNRRIILVCFLSKSRANLGATPLRMITYQDMP